MDYLDAKKKKKKKEKKRKEKKKKYEERARGRTHSVSLNYNSLGITIPCAVAEVLGVWYKKKINFQLFCIRGLFNFRLYYSSERHSKGVGSWVGWQS